MRVSRDFDRANISLLRVQVLIHGNLDRSVHEEGAVLAQGRHCSVRHQVVSHMTRKLASNRLRLIRIVLSKRCITVLWVRSECSLYLCEYIKSVL